MSIEQPEKGKISFMWFNNYAGIIIRTPSVSLVIDPVGVKPDFFEEVDAVLITHEHFDHLDEILVRELHRRTNCTVVADRTSASRIRRFISEGKLEVVKSGVEVSIGKVKVRAEECNHPPASTPVTYLITSEDDITIFHTADSLPFPRMREIGEKFKPNITFCTVGIAPGASPRTGVEIAIMVKPEIAIPYHARTTMELRRFAEILKNELPQVKCMLIEKGKVYTYPE